jgi:hypothetical protein
MVPQVRIRFLDANLGTLRAEVRGPAQYLCAKSALLWTCTNYAAQRSMKVFPAATLLVLALRAH